MGASDFFVLDRMAQNLDDYTMEKVLMMRSMMRSKMAMMGDDKEKYDDNDN